MKVIILAAGIGSRLGNSIPKTLTKIETGETILGRQINFLKKEIEEENITVVVGYKKKSIMNKFPKINYIHNPLFRDTNTAKSLLCALKNNYDSDIIWLNGDIVFDSAILKPLIKFKRSCMLVNTNSVYDEEVKYNLNEDGSIKQVSKIINDGLGEAVGINKILKSDIKQFSKKLKECGNNDYFERALELIIKDGSKIYPLNISNYFCHEIDNKEDLNFVNKHLKKYYNV